MADPPPHGPPPNLDVWTFVLTKVAPALAGAYVRNLFPPRKRMRDRIAEALGGVLMVIYAGHVAAGALWAVLGWLLARVGITDPASVIDRQESNLLAAFLVGLVGMTIVEGGILFIRKTMNAKTPA